MKKLFMFVIGALFLAGTSYAACMLGGAFCADDQGASIAGSLFDGNGDGMANLTSAQVSSATPRAVGQEIYCTDCTTSRVCVSSGTTRGAYVVGVATGPFTSASYPHCS